MENILNVLTDRIRTYPEFFGFICAPHVTNDDTAGLLSKGTKNPGVWIK